MEVFFFNCSLANIAGELSINGIPVWNCSTGFKEGTVQVNQFVIDGRNQISFTVNSLSKASESSRGVEEVGNDEIPSLKIEFCRCVDQEIPGEGPFEILTRLPALITEANETEANEQVTQISTLIDLRSPFPRWAWQDAARLSLSDPVITSAVAFLGELHKAISTRDLDRFTSLGRTVISEVAPAYGNDVEQALSEFRQLYEQVFARPDWSIAPLETGQVAFRLCGSENLLKPTLSDGRHVLRAASFDTRGGGWFLPVLIGKHEGQWKMLR